MLALPATPRAIVDKPGAEVAKIVALPDIREKPTSQGMEPFTATPDQFAALIKSDLATMPRCIVVRPTNPGERNEHAQHTWRNPSARGGSRDCFHELRAISLTPGPSPERRGERAVTNGL